MLCRSPTCRTPFLRRSRSRAVRQSRLPSRRALPRVQARRRPRPLPRQGSLLDRRRSKRSLRRPMLEDQAPLARPQLRRCARFGSERRLRRLLNLRARRLDSPFHLRMRARQARRYASRRCGAPRTRARSFPSQTPFRSMRTAMLPTTSRSPMATRTRSSGMPPRILPRRLPLLNDGEVGRLAARRPQLPPCLTSTAWHVRRRRELRRRLAFPPSRPMRTRRRRSTRPVRTASLRAASSAHPMTWPLCSQREVSRARASKK